MQFIEYLRAFWPVVTGLTPLAVACVILWLRSQFASKNEAVTKGSLAAVEHRLNATLEKIDARLERGDDDFEDHEKRISLLEQSHGMPPTRHEMAKDITVLLSRTSQLEADVRSVGKQLATANTYLQQLISRGLGQK